MTDAGYDIVSSAHDQFGEALNELRFKGRLVVELAPDGYDNIHPTDVMDDICQLQTPSRLGLELYLRLAGVDDSVRKFTVQDAIWKVHALT